MTARAWLALLAVGAVLTGVNAVAASGSPSPTWIPSTSWRPGSPSPPWWPESGSIARRPSAPGWS